jgi:hypothetical protein
VVGSDDTISSVACGLQSLNQVLSNQFLQLIPDFKIADNHTLPYGLKPHTRSVSWLAEQVINQQLRYHEKALGLSKVNYDWPDTSLWDVSFNYENKSYFVNVKVHQATNRGNLNDISAVEKLYIAYRDNPKFDLYYAVFGISFKGNRICFDRNRIIIFSPQFMPIYVNPRNDKLQAKYDHVITYRSRYDFLREIKQKSRSILL